MILKSGQELNLVTSYRLISVLPIIIKVFDKILISGIKPELKILDHQFGFRINQSAVRRAHRIIGKIKRVLEIKRYSFTTFLDIEAAFN